MAVATKTATMRLRSAAAAATIQTRAVDTAAAIAPYAGGSARLARALFVGVMVAVVVAACSCAIGAVAVVIAAAAAADAAAVCTAVAAAATGANQIGPAHTAQLDASIRLRPISGRRAARNRSPLCGSRSFGFCNQFYVSMRVRASVRARAEATGAPMKIAESFRNRRFQFCLAL